MALCNVWRYAIVWSFDACDILNCSCQGLFYFMKYIFVGHWTLETLHHKLICNQIVLICWRLFYHLNQFDIPSKCQIVYSLEMKMTGCHVLPPNYLDFVIHINTIIFVLGRDDEDSKDSWLFTVALYNGYGPPKGFCFDQ